MSSDKEKTGGEGRLNRPTSAVPRRIPRITEGTPAPTRIPRRSPETAAPRQPQPPASFPTATFEDTTTTGMRSRRIETERRKVRQRQRHRKIRTVVVLGIVSAILMGCFYLAYSVLRGTQPQTVGEDYPGPGSGEVTAIVNPGDTGTAIAAELLRLDVVKSAEAFIRAWEANQAASSVQPGSYTLKLQMNSTDAVAALLDPTNRTSNAISIPSGFTIWQVKERMKAHPSLNPDEVEAAFNDTANLGLPAEAKGNLEGWLYPGSYEVHQEDTPQQVLKTMVAKTVEELDRLKVPAGQRQIVLIKASILEREVNGPTYMKQVARVIENRLEKVDAETVGLLQMDSTVNYGLKRAGGIPSSAEVKQDTPYNTYIHKGLPPAPISMPSEAAVEAILNPAAGDWLYFVTVNLKTGETKFSSTNAEHEKYVEELKAWCKENKGNC